MSIKPAQKFFSFASEKAGFTLIELLVVIGILGILAAALVATIDPFEQLKKGNDANAENTEIEFINAVIRYYTINNGFPWDGTNAGGTDCAGIALDPDQHYDLPISQMNTLVGNCLTVLVNAGELKPAFETATGILSTIWIYETGNSLTACYNPESKSKTTNNQTKWVPDNAAAPTSFTEDTGAGDCAGVVQTGSGLPGTDEDCFRCTEG